jgi:hypothetical protein
MKWCALFALLFAVCLSAQTQKTIEPPSTEKLCGKLVHSERIPVKNQTNTYEEKTKNLGRVVLRLYAAVEGRSCCEGLFPKVEATTGKWGSFHFKEKCVGPGLYWLVAKVNNREYKLLVQYAPKANSTELCSGQSWELDDAGNFWKAELITVD